MTTPRTFLHCPVGPSECEGCMLALGQPVYASAPAVIQTRSSANRVVSILLNLPGFACVFALCMIILYGLFGGE